MRKFVTSSPHSPDKPPPETGKNLYFRVTFLHACFSNNRKQQMFEKVTYHGRN
jgi:hypothetical protein